MSAVIAVSFAVPVGHEPGDYAVLHGNGGAGAIDWDTPVDSRRYALFPNGGGIYGWGHAPWGHFRWGHAHSMRCPGWGHLPWGHFPWGHGTALISATVQVESCGDYLFGFKVFDKLGNEHEGSPGQVEAIIHIAPPAPTGLTKNSYDPGTDVLVLDAA